MSYVLQVETLDKRSHLKTLLDGFAVAQGAEIEVEDPMVMREEFDKALCAPPPNMDDDEQALRMVLGVGLRG